MIQKKWANKVKQKSYVGLVTCHSVGILSRQEACRAAINVSLIRIGNWLQMPRLNCHFKLNPSGCLEELLVDEEEVGDLVWRRQICDWSQIKGRCLRFGAAIWS